MPDDNTTKAPTGASRPEQLALDMVAAADELSPERRIAQAAHAETAAMISAVITAIPMVGHRKGTARETLQRPVAYLYACRERLGDRDRDLAVHLCSRVTSVHLMRIKAALGPLCERAGRVETAPLWLRMNGEPARGSPASTNARDAWRLMEGKPERDGYAWALSIAQRCPDSLRASLHFGQGQLRELAPQMLGTLAGWLLVLRWTPALAHVVRWRLEGHDLGEDMLARRDVALDWGKAVHMIEERDMAETYHLAQLDPATSMLARAVMTVRREDKP